MGHLYISLLCWCLLSTASAVTLPQATARVYLSWVYSEQVRTLYGEGTELPLTVSWWYSDVDPSVDAPINSTKLYTIDRADSYQVTNEFLFDWNTFFLGAALHFRFSFEGNSPFVVGDALVRLKDLTQKGVTYDLGNGVVAIRQTPLPEPPSFRPPFTVGLSSILINRTRRLTLPEFYLLCNSNTGTTRSSVNGTSEDAVVFKYALPAVTGWGVRQSTDYELFTWDRAQLGPAVVCGLYELDSVGVGGQPDRGIAVVSLEFDSFPQSRVFSRYASMQFRICEVAGNATCVEAPPVTNTASSFVLPLALLLLIFAL